VKTKKNAVDLTDLALGIVVLGIIVSIGANILVNVRDSQLTDLPTVTTNNETTFINATGDNFANTWVNTVDSCFANFTGSGTVTTANTSIPSANYSLSVNAANGVGTITNGTTVVYADAACTYTTYDTTQANWALADDAANGLAEYGDWFDIIVIVGIAAVIIALIFMAFGRGGSSSPGIGGSY
jgi:hypothetical protein